MRNAKASPLVSLKRAEYEGDPQLYLLAELGSHGVMRSWDSRPVAQQELYETRLKSFLNWRRYVALEELPDGLWDSKPPDKDTLRNYLTLLRGFQPNYRSQIVTALRYYFQHVQRPDLLSMLPKRRGRY